MSFLAPLYLLLAGAAAVPLLLHLLRRRIGTRVEFPAARYLARAERENSRKLRLRNLLLMMLRIAAVLLLAAAAARPVARFAGAGHVPTAMAIVLDNSMSTSAIVDGAPLFTRLRDAARQLAGRANAGDRVWLLTADGAVVGGSLDAVRDAIARAEPFAGRGDIQAAVARAGGLVRASGLVARNVAVITDGQATAWPATLSLGDVRVSAFAPAGAAPANHAIIEAESRPTRWTPRGSVVARAAGADSSTYRIAIGGRTLARGTARGNEEILVRAAPSERGWLAGSVELEPDELRADDARHFAVWIGAAPTVTLDPSLGPFVKSAVDALVQSERLRLGTGASIVAADALGRLPALIVAPSDPVRLGAANRALERAGVPWRFGAVRRGESAVRGDGEAGRAFEGATASVRYPLVAREGALGDTLARAGGDPWVVAGERYVIVASPLDPAATSFPLRAGFLPWLADVVSQRLGGESGSATSVAPRAPFHAPPGVQALEDAGGREIAFDARQAIAPERSGVYFLKRGTTRVGALVVNGEAEESRLDRLSRADLRARLGGREVNVDDDPARWSRDAFDANASRPIVTPLLVAALVILVAEAILASGVARPRLARAA